VQALVRDLNRLYRTEPALYELDFEPSGFLWLEPNDADATVLAFARLPAGTGRPVVCICNLSPVPRDCYRVGLPRPGLWRELVNTDSTFYGGSDVGNLGGIEADGPPWHEQGQSAELQLPPLAVLWLVPDE
jgi:1,4-alpha-glucan branching enzyme